MNSAPNDAAVDDSIHLLDLLLILAQRRRLLLLLPLVFASLALAYSFVTKPKYKADVLIMPPQQQQSSAAAMLSQLGGLGGLGGLAGGALGLKNPNDMYIGLLKSRRVSDTLVTRFKLQNFFQVTSPEIARARLRKNTTIESGKDNIISITVVSTDPKVSANIANGYVDALRSMLSNFALTEAQQRRLFFERQLHDIKNQLAEAEVNLTRVQQKTGILDANAQGAATIASLSQLKAQIAAKEVGLQAMRSYATANNPDYVRAQNELAGLQAQLGRLTSGKSEDDVFLVKSRAPQLTLEYVRQYRNVQYYQTLFEILAKQYEIARVDEAREGAVVQVIDAAVPPAKPFKPQRFSLILLGLAAGFFLAILTAFAQHALTRVAEGPDGEKMRAVRAALRWRRAV